MQEPSTGDTPYTHSTTPPDELSSGGALQPAPIRPALSRRKLLFWGLAALALGGSFPLGAYLTLKATERPIPSSRASTPLDTATPAPSPTLTPDQQPALFCDQMI